MLIDTYLRMMGTLINVGTVLLGSVLGLLLGKAVPDRLRVTVMQGIGLCVLIIGITSAIETADILGVIVCMVLGALIGEGLDIERRLESLGARAERLLTRGAPAEGSTFVQGFMAASLLFCVGPMSIIGPLESGLSQNHATQIAKALMDGTASVFLAAALGPGVALSALMILLYQGAITLAAGLVSPLLTEAVIVQMSATGGVIILGIGLNMLEAAKVRVGNLLPAIFLPILYAPVAAWIGNLL